jgi:serine/threonine protein kinase
MLEDLQQFGNLSIARRAGGTPVELERSKDEVVFLAFDNRIRRLVELHVLRGGSSLDAAGKRSAFERARLASEIRNHTFMRILELGEDEGLVYYTSNLNDGEFVDRYVKRRGAISAPTALALVYQLLDDLLHLKDLKRLMSGVHIDRVLVTTLEDTFLQLRVVDYGLSRPEAGAEGDSGGRLVAEACRLMFLLLTGEAYNGENPDRFPALTQLPMSLRTAMRSSLSDPENSPTSVEKLRDDVREAFSALSNSIQGRNLRKHLVVITPLLPASQLQDLLLENVPVETILGTRFQVEDEEQVRRYPFSIPALNVKSEQPVMVHLLPPSRIVEKDRYEAVPLQMWRFNPERHPNILRSLSLWESPDWTFLTEEREPGFALSRLMAERITLNPNEVLVLMRQVCSGLEQAVECGVHRVDLHPSNILLQVGKRGPLLSREIERFIQKRLDAWPKFLVKLRPHMTMRSLYEPLLVDMDIPDGAHQEEHLMDRDFKHRSFVALAAYLLSGQRQSSGAPLFPESLPEAAATYVRECMELSKRYGKTPAPAEFMARFESALSAPVVEFATRLRGHSVAIEEMDSAGVVSDYDGEWSDDVSDAGLSDGMPFDARRMKAHDFNSVLDQRRGFPWAALAAAAVVALSIGAWFVLGGASGEPAPDAVAAMPSSEAEGPESHPAAASVPDAPVDKPVPAKLRTVAPIEVGRPAVDSPQVIASKAPVSAPPRNLAANDANKESATEQGVSVVAGNLTEKPTVQASSNAGGDAKLPSAAAPPVKVAKEPLTIRRAILPSPEELDRMKQGHVQNKVGTLPVMSTASQMPLKKEKLKP